MRRLVGAATLLLLTVAVAACGKNPNPRPTVPSADFAPEVVITVDERGMAMEPSGADGGTLEVPYGTVAEVRNAGTADHRVEGGPGGSVFDTGILRPNDTTTVVFTKSGELEIQAADTTDQRVTLTVGARPRD